MSNRLPTRALDIQLDLLRYYENDAWGRAYSDGVIEVALINHLDWQEGAGRDLHRRILATGDTYAITGEIVDVIQQISPKLPSFRFDASDLPSTHGFVWLETPIIVHDINRKPLVVHAFGWHLTGIEPREGNVLLAGDPTQALTVLGWTKPSDPRDYAFSEWEDRELMNTELHAPHGLMSMICAVWPMGEDWDEPEYGERLGGRSELLQFFVSFLRFIGQKFVDYSTVMPDKHLRKRADRARGHHLEQVEHIPEIHIVQLRKRLADPSKGTGENPVNWTHRWIVNPHWRDQWYPSLGVHKPIPIFEYVKGPADKPLVVSDRIFSVER